MEIENKEIQFTKCIFLRKLSRQRNHSLGRIPLLIFKYEILPNLCFKLKIDYDKSQGNSLILLDKVMMGHSSTVRSVALSNDQKWIVSGS